MNWGAIIVLTLAILGAALMAGGIILYRGSPQVNGRAFGAAAVAAGAVMWLIILLTTPV
jgi:hypothetical protein